MRKKRRSRPRPKYLGVVGIAALAVVTAGAVGFVVLEPHQGAEVPEKVQEYYNDSLKTGAAIPTPTAVQPVSLTRSIPGEPLRVLFAGDSLTDGYFASEQAKSFKQIVLDQLGPVELTTAALAKQTLSTVSKVTDVPADLDLAVVELGTNDVGIPTPIAEFTTQYDALLAKIKAKSPNTALLCAGTWEGTGTQYDIAIAKSCTKAGGRYISLAGLYQNSSFHGPAKAQTWKGESDWFHPNDAGHAAIAKALLAAVQVQP